MLTDLQLVGSAFAAKMGGQAALEAPDETDLSWQSWVLNESHRR
jgi:hypothetical protein